MKLLIAFSLLVVTTLLAYAQETLPNEFCPVTPSDRAESDISTEYKGQTIYFCCKSCLRDFNKDPEAYLANLETTSGSNDFHAQSESGHSHDDASANAAAQSHEHTEKEANSHASEHSHESAAEQEGHDHSDHDGDSDSLFLPYMGKLHVVVVHFPVALLPFGAFLVILGAFRTNPILGQSGVIVWHGGTAAAVIAAIFGWIAASQSSYPDHLDFFLETHRWLGTSVAILALAGSALFWRTASQPIKTAWQATIAGLIGILVLATAHFGGSLIYGKDYLF